MAQFRNLKHANGVGKNCNRTAEVVGSNPIISTRFNGTCLVSYDWSLNHHWSDLLTLRAVAIGFDEPSYYSKSLRFPW